MTSATGSTASTTIQVRTRLSQVGVRRPAGARVTHWSDPWPPGDGATSPGRPPAGYADLRGQVPGSAASPHERPDPPASSPRRASNAAPLAATGGGGSPPRG